VAIWMNKKVLLLTIAAMTAAAFLVAIMLSPAAARAECTADQFTVNGVFDLQGYLACQVASAGPVPGATGSGVKAAGSGLPVTGSDATQLVGIALAIAVVGIAGVLVSNHERRKQSV
jgi:hypothetical protein